MSEELERELSLEREVLAYKDNLSHVLNRLRVVEHDRNKLCIENEHLQQRIKELESALAHIAATSCDDNSEEVARQAIAKGTIDAT